MIVFNIILNNLLRVGITKQFKLTAFYAFGFLEYFKVDDPLKVSCST